MSYIDPNILDTLVERGFVEQYSNEANVRKLLANERVTFYSGFDPTADSLTVGHFIPVMAMAHLQRAGHRPIALVGGGTGFIGDPTDKSDMRRMMTRQEIKLNVDSIQGQLSKFLDFGKDNAIMVDNADWLLKLNYVDFIREYGVHFTVNKMLTADAYRTRFERGLTFFEFNYMIMQAYDFLQLFRQYNCKLQMGGNDQWSNILAGADLIRRAEKNPDAECFTVKLLLTSEGKKMGKSQKGAVWLDPNKTSPHEFFQYWRNIEDADVIKCMKLVTFLPMNEIQDMEGLSGGDVNKAKEKLAYEVTKLIHGSDEAEKALKAARSLFGGAGGNEDAIPLTEISSAEWGDGMNIVLLLEKAGLIASRGEGRKLIRQGGIRVNDKKIDSFEHLVTYMPNGRIMLQKGKKTFHRIKIV